MCDLAKQNMPGKNLLTMKVRYSGVSVGLWVTVYIIKLLKYR
jgi:hypothetical protein